MVHPVQAQQRQHLPPQVGVEKNARGTPTLINGGSQPESGYLESLLIRIKDLIFWLFELIFCRTPQTSEKKPSPPQIPKRNLVPENLIIPGSRQENRLLILRLEQESDLQKEHILNQIGQEVWKKGGSLRHITYLRQSYQEMGKNAVTTNPQLLKPYLQ